MEQIVFPRVGIVHMHDRLGNGHSRTAYACDYKDADGREYVIKYGHKDSGRVTNMAEYTLYQNSNKHFKECVAVFADCTADGKYVLVERVITAHASRQHEQRPVEQLRKIKSQQFNSMILEDMHEENWGFSLHDGRPVIIDVAYDEATMVRMAIRHECDVSTVIYAIHTVRVWNYKARYIREEESAKDEVKRLHRIAAEYSNRQAAPEKLPNINIVVHGRSAFADVLDAHMA